MRESYGMQRVNRAGRRFQEWAPMLAIVVLAVAPWAGPHSEGLAGENHDPAPVKAMSDDRDVELRGRIVCLIEAHPNQGALPPGHVHDWGFQSSDGRLFHIERNKISKGLLTDARLREKDLLLKGHLSAGKDGFEVTRMRSMKNGLVCDLFYYCSVCNIESVAPGPCECCQGPLELVEKPLGRAKDRSVVPNKE